MRPVRTDAARPSHSPDEHSTCTRTSTVRVLGAGRANETMRHERRDATQYTPSGMPVNSEMPVISLRIGSGSVATSNGCETYSYMSSSRLSAATSSSRLDTRGVGMQNARPRCPRREAASHSPSGVWRTRSLCPACARSARITRERREARGVLNSESYGQRCAQQGIITHLLFPGQDHVAPADERVLVEVDDRHLRYRATARVESSAYS